MMQSLFVARQMKEDQAEQKLVYLTAALVRDNEQAFGRQLLREIVYGAMLRLHQQLHPKLLSGKAQLASFRKQLCDAPAAGGKQLQHQELKQLHKRWSRLAPLLQCEEDDWSWAAFASATPAATFSKVLNRDKMIALAKRQVSWAHLCPKDKYNRWSDSMSNTTTAAQIDQWFDAEDGQLQRTSHAMCALTAANAHVCFCCHGLCRNCAQVAQRYSAACRRTRTNVAHSQLPVSHMHASLALLRASLRVSDNVLLLLFMIGSGRSRWIPKVWSRWEPPSSQKKKKKPSCLLQSCLRLQSCHPLQTKLARKNMQSACCKIGTAPLAACSAAAPLLSGRAFTKASCSSRRPPAACTSRRWRWPSGASTRKQRRSVLQCALQLAVMPLRFCS